MEPEHKWSGTRTEVVWNQERGGLEPGQTCWNQDRRGRSGLKLERKWLGMGQL